MDADLADVGPPKNRPFRARWSIFLGLLALFTALTYLAVSSGSPGDVHDRPVTLTTLATITGPFTGAIARHGQSCCLQFSLRLAAICGPVLALGLIAQLIPLPFRRAGRRCGSCSGRSAGSSGSSAATSRSCTPCSEPY